jgi:alpha-galactosidase
VNGVVGARAGMPYQLYDLTLQLIVEFVKIAIESGVF